MWVQEPGELGATATLPLHPHAAGRNSDFRLNARSRSKSPVRTYRIGRPIARRERSVDYQLSLILVGDNRKLDVPGDALDGSLICRSNRLDR